MKLKIKEFREGKMTQDELSKATGLSRQRISDLERLEDVNLSASSLKSLADALQCTMDDLLCD